MRRSATLLGLVLLLAAPAAAEEETPRVGVRVGDHPRMGRIVFDWPVQVGFRLEEQAGMAVIRFEAPARFDLSAVRRPPRNVTAITPGAEAVQVSIATGARPRVFRLGTRIVLDVTDAGPLPNAAAVTAASPAPTPPVPSAPAPRPAPAEAAGRAAGAPPAVAPRVPVAAPPPAPAASAELAHRAPSARLIASPGRPPGLALPAPAETGAALLRRGDHWLLVLDAPLAFDLTSIRAHPALASAEMMTGLDQAVLRLPAALSPAPRLFRDGGAWVFEVSEAPVPLRSILPEPEQTPTPRLVLRATRPARILTLADPETGASLLVGTVREGGEATPLARRLPQFDVLPTRLGVAILPRADTITLAALPDRFAVSASPGAVLSLGAEPGFGGPELAAMSRSFDLPPEPLPALQERLRNILAALSAAPPLARGSLRMDAAQAMLALGLPQEAQAMIALGIREDPRVAADPRARALHGVSALLAGRLGETEGLEGPGAPATDEIALWRGLLRAARGEEGAASAIAAGLPLLPAYPEPLRARILPLAAETLAAGGEAGAARRLLAGREEDASLAMARARLLEAEGALEPSLAAYDALASGRDRRVRAIALRRAVELRLARGLIDAAGAAAALEVAIAAWRGDAAETATRLRVAELRRAAGAPRAAFELLRETETLLPDMAPQLRPLQSAALAETLMVEPPLAAIGLFDAHADLLSEGPDSEAALRRLAEGLQALDLTERAAEVLRRAMQRATGPEGRARLGARLAAMLLTAGDAAGARTALAGSAAPGLPPELATERLLLEARALARAGEQAEAAERFRAAGPAGLPELVELLAERQAWGEAAEAMARLAEAELPPPPAPLPPAGAALLARMAAFLALAGDERGLASLRAAQAARMEGSPMAEAFSLLTAGRLASLDDLPRLRTELEVARALPSRLESLRAGAGLAR